MLDDNKLLTLAIGDRVSMPPSVRICFEVEHLNHASPATVSRAGIIFVSEEELGWLTLPTSMLIVYNEEEALPSPQVGANIAWRDFSLDLHQRHGSTICYIVICKKEMDHINVFSGFYFRWNRRNTNAREPAAPRAHLLCLRRNPLHLPRRLPQ